MKRRAGFFLVTVLLLLIILLVLCGAYLRSQVARYRAAKAQTWKAAAQQLALSGLEDVRLKLLKDGSFPPCSMNSSQFSYVEKVYDQDNQLVGSFQVRINSQKSDKPFYILLVQSEGRYGPVEKPIASHLVSAVCDLSPLARDGSGQPNPRFRRWVQYQDGNLPE